MSVNIINLDAVYKIIERSKSVDGVELEVVPIGIMVEEKTLLPVGVIGFAAIGANFDNNSRVYILDTNKKSMPDEWYVQNIPMRNKK